MFTPAPNKPTLGELPKGEDCGLEDDDELELDPNTPAPEVGSEPGRVVFEAP